MSLVRDTTLSAASTIVSSGSRFITTILLIRFLQPEAYGSFIYAQWLLDLLLMLCSLGLPGALTRFLPALLPSTSWRGSRQRLLLTAGPVVTSAIAIAAFAVIGAYAGWPLARILSLLPMGLAYYGWSYASPALQGAFRFDGVVAGNLAYALIAPIALLLLRHVLSLEIAALVFGCSWLGGLIAAIALSTRAKRPQADGATLPAPSLKELATYSLNVWLIGLIASLVWSRGELGILKLSVSATQIAIYGAALSLTGIITQAAGILTGALTPHLVQLHQAGRVETLDRVTRIVTEAVLLVVVFAAFVLSAGGEILVPTLFGSRYNESIQILGLLSVSTISIAAGCSNTLLQIQTNGRFGLAINLTALMILVAISLALTPILGVTGAAIARLCAQVVVGVLTFINLRRVEGLRKTSRDLLVAFCTSIACLGALLALKLFAHPGASMLLTAGALAATVNVFVVRSAIGIPILQLIKIRDLRS